MASQPNNPLHGIKLEQIINDLVDCYGWELILTKQVWQVESEDSCFIKKLQM